MNTTYHTPVRWMTDKQLKMITLLCWQIRPYYTHNHWDKLESQLYSIIEQADTQIASRLIKKIQAVLVEKQKNNATQYWIPMNYQFHKGSWRNNLLRLAQHLFDDEDEIFGEIPSKNPDTWRSLKNKIEAEELERSYRYVQDEFEKDYGFAREEEQRWQKYHAPYSQIVQDLDFLEPVAGIDY